MKKIDIFILKKILNTFTFVVLILVVIICVIDFTEKNDDFIYYDVPSDLIIRYYISFAPYFVVFLTPITAFIATILVTSKMAAQTELIAILSSGVSFRRLMRPFFIGATIIALVSFYLNGYIIPDGNKFRVDFEINHIDKPYRNSDRNIHIKVGPTDYVYINRYNNDQKIGYTVTLEQFVGFEMKEKIRAKRILWDSTGQTWQLSDWQKRTIREDIELIEEGELLDTLLNMRPSDFENQEKLETTLTMSELQDHINLQLSRGADDVMIYRTERYIRYMQPFTVIILCFIALIVSARKSRQGEGFQIALGFLIAFSFIILFVFAQAIAATGIMHPMLAIWIPNISFSGVGLLLYHTIPR